MSLWQTHHGTRHITSLAVNVWRVVEAQYKSGTRKWVDNQQEHDVLEDLLESAKPKSSWSNKIKGLDYLLYSPFRYPPLQYGSRFGRIFEPSLWYGSLELNTAFAEVAYYRLLFLSHTQAKFTFVDLPLTVFTAKITSNKAIKLTKKPFLNGRNKISSPHTYRYSQSLGSDMRAADIETVLYYSARDRHDGINVALFTPFAFANKKPNAAMQSWRCIANQLTVEFIRQDASSKERLPFAANEIPGLKIPTEVL